MDIISIDNCYEDDGLVQAQMQLAGFNGPNLDGTPHDVLVAIVPEYREDGRLDRLNFVTRPPDGQDQHCDKRYEQLTAAAAAIVADRQAAHAAAEANLEEPIIVPLDPSGV